ncbi:hypothetical protein BJ322DRAFT_1023199 [Thelephora terrestris]|uniref:Uncharacterized protein n=1 Tax=Thelephora terrestris TaxID=56493 RepID=A0A9P6H7E4_9AGAM|nr:hypothetical protein BJ322DRAFT_1023199 [Thelephora terrestris]
MAGGPCALGTGSLRISRTSSNGRSVHTGHTFGEFLGLLFKALKDKYWEWPLTAYTPQELLRQPDAQETDPDPASTPSSPTPRSSPNRSSTPVFSPPPSRPQSPAVNSLLTLHQFPLPAPTPLADVLLSTLPILIVRPPSASLPLPTIAPSPTLSPSPAQDTTISANLSTVTSPLSNAPHPQGDDEWPPQNRLTWKLEPQQPSYVCAAESFLIGFLADLSGLSYWSAGLSSRASPLPKLFQRSYHIPKVTSTEKFEGLRIQWWTAAQPEWSDTGSWRFPQGDVNGDWGAKLSSGGKDGLFLAVMSLGWWAHVQDLAVKSSLDAAINDVSWVMKQLITSISARTIAFSPLPDPLAASSQRRKRQTASGRADPPRKRLRA